MNKNVYRVTIAQEIRCLTLFSVYVEFTHLCHLFLESERESSASKREGPRSVRYVFQPLDDQRCWDAEWEIPYDVEVWRVCEDTHTRFSHTYFPQFDCRNSLRTLILLPPSHGLEIFVGNPRSSL